MLTHSMTETILIHDPHVRACLMFGRGRFQNVLLVQPTEPFDPRDETQLEAFRNLIWLARYTWHPVHLLIC